MRKLKKVHIKDPRHPRPYCDSRVAEPPMAKPGRLVSCKVCLRLLYHNAQYYNLLVRDGYTFPSAPFEPPQRTKKTDPRQMDFMLEE